MDTRKSKVKSKVNKRIDLLVKLLEDEYPRIVSYREIHNTCFPNATIFTRAYIHDLISKARIFLDDTDPNTRILTATGQGYYIYYPQLDAQD